MVHAELLLRQSFIQPPRAFGDHPLLVGGERPGVFGIPVDRRLVAVRGDEGRERLDQMPRGAVHARLVARMDVQARSAPPALAAGGQLELHDPLGAERHHHDAVQTLAGRGHEDAAAARERGGDIGTANDLREVR